MKNWRDVYPRPRADAVWCDECLRWETGAGRFPRVKRSRVADAVYAVARVFYRIGGEVSHFGDRFQIAKNRRGGVFDCVLEEKE